MAGSRCIFPHTICSLLIHQPSKVIPLQGANRYHTIRRFLQTYEKAGRSDQSRPILVKFSSIQVKESIMVAKKKLRSSTKENIYINEHLTKRTGELFALARNHVKQKKIHSSWTFKGQLFIKHSPDASAKPILIKSKDDLPR